MLASDWQNPDRARDVNNDNLITPLDALLGVNRLNQHAGALPARSSDSTEPYYDVNGDGFATAIDLLFVIDSLNGGLLVDAGLEHDTGFGQDAALDGLTNDSSIRGHVQGQPDFLQLRLGASGAWQEVPGGFDANGNFSIPSATLDSLSDGPLADGNYVLDLRAGHTADPIELADRTVIKWQLDRTPPTSRFIGEILMSDPKRIVVPLSEQVSSQQIDGSSVYLYDVSWGEKAVGSPWDVDGNHPRFQLQARSITISPSGRELIIEPPVLDRSIKYLVEIGAAVQDKAGNKFDVDGSAQTLIARANYFAQTAPLEFNTTYTFKPALAAKVIEYTINIDHDDVLIWSGDRTVGNISRYELYDAHGTLLHVLSPTTSSGPGEAAAPAYWPVVAGNYHLRKIDPPLGGGTFKLYRASQLPELPASRIVTESDGWPIDFYKANLTAGDRVYLESQSVIRTMTAVYDPLGERITLNNIQTNDQLLDVGLSGDYIFGAWRIDFRSYRSSLDISAPNRTGAIDGQLNVPGERKQVTFVTLPGEVYALDASQSDPAIEFTVQAHQSDSLEWIIAAQQTSLTISISKASAVTAPLAYHLRLSKLSTAPVLPLDTPIDSPASGATAYYRGSSNSSGKRLLLDGDDAYALIDFDSAGNLSMQQGMGPLVISNLDDYFLVRVKGSGSTAPWRARTVETISRSLDVNGLTTLEFKHGFERYELAITGAQDEILTLDDIRAQVGQTVDIAVLDTADASARGLSSEWPGSNVQFLHPGVYKLVVSGHGLTSRGSYSFRASSSEGWPALPYGVTQTVSTGEHARYKLAAGLERLYLNTLSARSGSAWIVANQRGEVVKRLDIIEGSSNNNDLDLSLSPLDQHYLIATTDDNTFRGPFEFVSRQALTNVISSSLGAQVSGQLSGPGDRVIVRYDLQRGQRVQLTSLGINPQQVSFEWKNVPGPSEINQPWLVPVSMTYELILTSRSTSAQAYNLKLAQAPSEVMGHGLTGFGVIRSGTVSESAYTLLPFEVEAGALFMLDWQQAGASVEIAIISPSGDVLQTRYDSDTSLIKAETSGVYLVRLGAYFADTQPFRFIMRDLSSSESIGLSQEVSLELAPFESQLLQLPLSVVTDLLPQDNSQSGVRIELRSSLPGGQTGQTYAAGIVAVLVVNETSDTSPMNLVVHAASGLNTIEIDVPRGMQLSPGMSYSFRFTTSEPGIDVGLRLAIPDVFVQVSNALGDIQRNVFGLFHLANVGDYQLTISMPSNGESQIVNLLLARSITSSAPYSLGSSVTDSLPAMGNERRYAFTVAASGPVLVGFSGISSLDVRLSTADGRQLNLTTDSDWRLPSVQYLASGSYVLTIVAPQDQFTYGLYLQSLSSAPLLQAVEVQGRLSDSELFRVFRYEAAQSEQLIWTNRSEQIQFVQLYSASGLPVGDGDVLRVDPTHPLLVVVQGKSTAYQFSLLKPFRTEYDLTVGQVEKRVVSSKAETQVARFEVNQANVAIEFASGDAFAVLIKPDGSRVPFNRSEPSLFTDLVAGTYRIEINALGSAVSYSLTVLELDSVASIELGNTKQLVSANYYKLDLSVAGLFRIHLVDGAGRASSLSALQMWNNAGQFMSPQDQMQLAQGTNWFKFNSPVDGQGPFRLRVTSSNSQIIVGALDQSNSVVLDDQTDVKRLRIPLPAGGLVSMAELALSNDTFARYRFIPASGSLADAPLWQGIFNFPRLWPVPQAGTLEFEFNGQGTSTIRLVDLPQSPALVLGQEQAINLPSSTQLQAWRMPKAANWSLQFSLLESSGAVATWYLVDDRGELHPLPGKNKTISSVSSAPLYLIAFLTNSAPSKLRVRVDAPS